MKKFSASLVLLLAALTTQAQEIPGTRVEVRSPDGRHVFAFWQQADPAGRPEMFYRIDFDARAVVLPSRLDIRLDNRLWERALAKQWEQPARWNDLMLLDSVEYTEQRGAWKPLYGERAEIPDNYNGATIRFSRGDATRYRMNIEVRAYDEGVAFRYRFPMHPEAIYHRVTAENTEFTMPAGTLGWWTNWAQGPYELKPLTEWEDSSETPLTLQLADGLYACIAEAARVEFSQMRIAPAGGNRLVSQLYAPADQVTPFGTPWRVVMVAERLGGLLEHNYILQNLNAPSRIADPSWIRPGKILRETTLSTDNALACIDFCAAHGMQYILFDAGWYGPHADFASDASQVVRPALDMPRVVAYGKEKGVGVWVYVNQHALQYQADRIFPIYKQWGLAGVKFGFVQFKTAGWAAWVHRTLALAAENGLLVNIHDEYRPTGIERTWPNLLTSEGIRGNEEFPSATDNTLLSFTRMIAGAADYTVCYFDPRLTRTTHAHQLALPVIFYSPLQTLYWYDRPARIAPVAELEFFDRVPVSWDRTVVLDARPGQCVTIARQKGEEWFVGAICGDRGLETSIPLHMLEAGKKYVARIFTDDPTADSPTRVRANTAIVDAESVLKFRLADGGGCALILTPATAADRDTYPAYRP